MRFLTTAALFAIAAATVAAQTPARRHTAPPWRPQSRR